MYRLIFYMILKDFHAFIYLCKARSADGFANKPPRIEEGSKYIYTGGKALWLVMTLKTPALSLIESYKSLNW